MPSIVYNVLIGGQSVGLTFHHWEATNWVKQSFFQGKKEIRAVPYSAPVLSYEMK